MAVKSVFDIQCFKDVKFGVENQFYIKIYGNQKTIFSNITPPPRVPAKAFACICVTIFYTLFGSGLLAQGGGEMFSSPKTQGLSP